MAFVQFKANPDGEPVKLTITFPAGYRGPRAVTRRLIDIVSTLEAHAEQHNGGPCRAIAEVQTSLSKHAVTVVTLIPVDYTADAIEADIRAIVADADQARDKATAEAVSQIRPIDTEWSDEQKARYTGLPPAMLRREDGR